MTHIIGQRRSVLFQGPVFSLSGYGDHARDLVLGLMDDNRYNVGILPVGWGATSTAGKLSRNIVDKLMFGVNNKFNYQSMNGEFVWIQCTVPNEFRRVSKFNVGITAGLESTNIPEDWVRKCNLMNLIIVPSTFMKDMFLRCGVTVPVEVLFEGVDLEVFNSEPLHNDKDFEKILDAKITTPFNFLFTGQWMKVKRGTDRKQVATLIEIFMDTFKNMPEVGLVLKTFSANNSTPDREFTHKRIQQIVRGEKSPIVYLIHGELTQRELATLYRFSKVKCFASVTSGEGWNRGSAEACACGLPVAITGWSGHMDYISKEHSIVFDYVYRDIPQQMINLGYYQRGMKWAAVDIQDVKDKLKYVYDNHNDVIDKAVLYADIFKERYSLDKMQKEFAELLYNQSKTNPDRERPIIELKEIK